MKINLKSILFVMFAAILFCAGQMPARAALGENGVHCRLQHVDDCTIVWECSNGAVSEQITDHDNCEPMNQVVIQKPLPNRKPGRR